MLRIGEQGLLFLVFHSNENAEEVHMKKKYIKPEITKVELKPEEAVLTKCKRKQDAICQGTAKTAWS